MSEESENSMPQEPKVETNREDAGASNASPGKISEADRRRKVGAAHQQPELSLLSGGGQASGGRESVSPGVASGHGGAAQTGGGSDFFRPRAGSDSRAPSVLGKMASMTRTRWRSGEGQSLQPGQQPPVPGVSQTIHAGSDAPSGPKNRSVFDIFPKNFRPRSKSDAAGKMKRPKAGSSDSGRQSGSSTPRSVEHGRSPPPTPAGGSVTPGAASGGASGGAVGGYLPNAASPYTTYHGGMFSGPQRGQKTQGHRDLSYLFADPRALLAQDRRSRLSLHGFSERYELENVADTQVFVKFMKSHRCHDLIPDGYNNKLIVFDTQLKVQKAFFALMEHGVRAAPLWDSTTQDFVGMLTISDFITILQKYYRSPLSSKNDIKSHMIVTWRDVLKNHNELIASNKLISIGPDASLYEAIKALHEAKIHRLAVMDAWSGNVIQILTHKRLLRFLFQFNHELPRPSFVFKQIQELGVGTYGNIVTVNPETPLINALNKFCKHRFSSLPVVDKESGCLVDIYAKYDTIKLASNQTYNNLDITIRQALQYGNERGVGGPYTCRKEESLQKVMERIVRCNVHRLVIVDENCRVEGIVSLSDIVYFIVLRQEELQIAEQQQEQQLRSGVESPLAAASDVDNSDSAVASGDSENHFSSSEASLSATAVTDPKTTIVTATMTSSSSNPSPLSSVMTPPHPQSRAGGGGSKSPSPANNRPALKLYVPPSPAATPPPQQLHQQQQLLLTHHRQQQQPLLYRNGDSPSPVGFGGGGGGGGGEKTPSPLRETFPTPSSSTKGKKMPTPMRKKSIVDEIIPEFPTAIDLNVPELV